MNRARLHGNWLRLAGATQRMWGALVADETLRMHGERDIWMGRMEIEASTLRSAPLSAPHALTNKAWRM